MKRAVICGTVILAGLLLTGVAWAQSLKDVYKSLKKVELSADIGASKSFKDAMIDARTEFDLFKGSEEARKNPEFARHIEAAMEDIKKAYGLSWMMAHGFSGQINMKPVPGSSGVEYIDKWNGLMAEASAEMEAAKRYLTLPEAGGAYQSKTPMIQPPSPKPINRRGSVATEPLDTR